MCQIYKVSKKINPVGDLLLERYGREKPIEYLCLSAYVWNVKGFYSIAPIGRL